MTDDAPDGVGTPPGPDSEDGQARELAERIARFERRRGRGGEHGATLWSQVAKVGTLGWLVALPIVGGALLGHLIDRRLDSGVTWALALMLLGVGAGGYFLWRGWSDIQER